MGCGIRLAPSQDQKFGGNFSPEIPASKVVVFFTKNGKEVGSQIVPLPPGGFFPAISLQVRKLKTSDAVDYLGISLFVDMKQLQLEKSRYQNLNNIFLRIVVFIPYHRIISISNCILSVSCTDFAISPIPVRRC